MNIYNTKKLQFMQMLTAICSVQHIENRKSYELEINALQYIDI